MKTLKKAKTSDSVSEPDNKSKLSFREDYRGTRLLPSLVQVVIAVLNDLHLIYGSSDPPQQGPAGEGQEQVKWRGGQGRGERRSSSDSPERFQDKEEYEAPRLFLKQRKAIR